MTPQDEKRLLQSLYDRLFDAITYAPGGDRAPLFDRATSFVQFSKNEALNPADFTAEKTKDNPTGGPMSPINPKGDFRAARAFSEMVNQIPNVSVEFSSSGKRVDETYRELVDGADAKNEDDPQQQAKYDQAFNFLNQKTSIPNFDGEPTVQWGPTAIAKAYNDNQSAYITAVSGYRAALNGYDMNNPTDQRAWQAVAPGLQLNIDRTWNTWRDQGKQQVEKAQAALASTINNFVAAAIKRAQSDVSDIHWLAGLTQSDNEWMLSYALPSDWATNGSGATDFSLNSSYMQTQTDSRFDSYGGGGSWGGGLWSVGGSFSGSSGSTNYHMEANNISISAKIQTVRIMRSWYNPLLFTLKGWWLTDQPAGAVSNGQLKGNENSMFPLVPTAIVVARDVTIAADFSSEDKSHVESAFSASARVGWGPFSVSGNYSHSESHDKFQAQFDGAKLRIPGMQILAWISTITPFAAPAAAKAQSAG